MHHCNWMPPKECPPVVHPTQTKVVDVYQPYVVPHIHTTHTKYQIHNVYQHKHYCKETESSTCHESHQHMNCNCDMCQNGHHGHHHGSPWDW